MMDNPSDHTVNNNVVTQLLKECTAYLSASDTRFTKKLFKLNELYAMWNTDTDEDYSADVYGRVAEMFAANVFRPLSPSSYSEADDEAGAGPPVVISEPTADEMVEFTQTVLAYQVFQAFVERVQFDADMAQPHVHRRFVNGLMQRLNSADAAERVTVRDIAERVWVTCPAAQQTVFRAATDELADFAYGYVPRHNGVNELLDFFAGTAGNAAVPEVSKVLVRLLKHPTLFSFKPKLIECARALNNDYKDLIPQMLTLIKKLWSCQHLKTIVLLQTMIELYEWCDKDRWIQLQVQIVGYLSKLFSNNDFQVADVSMNFWNRILHENMKLWKNKPDLIKIVVVDLKKVEQTHWNQDCIKMANFLLKLMVTRKIIDDTYAEDPEETFRDDKANGKSYDLMTTHNTLMPLKHSRAMVDNTPTNTESIV